MVTWKQIKTLPKYEVSDRGQVRNAKKKNIRRPYCLNGYLKINIPVDGKKKNHFIHRLVAEAFLTDFHPDKQVDHINRIRNDNRVQNLRCVNGLKNSKNKIHSVGVVEHIIQLHQEGFTPRQIYQSIRPGENPENMV